MNKQTIARVVGFSGVGVHSGKAANLSVEPSSDGRLVFERTDLGGLRIPLDARSAGARQCTFVQSGQASVLTIEHLLAALRMTGVDSALIKLDAEEVPILDGSAAPFIRSLSEAGLIPLPEPRVSIEVSKSFRLEEDGASLAFEPGPDLRVSYLIEFSHALIGRQELGLSLTPESFASEIAPARTFGFLEDAERLRDMGLALGSSLENTVVLDVDRVVNPPLRFPDEFVRHKILDLAGDLAVAGAPILGRVRAERAGHSLHLRALQGLLQSPSHWAFKA